MLKFIFSGFILLFAGTVMFAQHEADISGVWTGTLYQNEGGIADKFELYFDLEQIGPVVKGKAYVRLGELYAEMHLRGYQTGAGSWHITETEILRNDKAGMAVSWCMKEYELRINYTKGELVLNGPWWGSSDYGPCIPGSITLRRKAKVALLIFGGEYPIDVQPHRHIHNCHDPFDWRLPIRGDQHAVA